MPRNVYFSQGATPEKRLYEDITIEALKIYGHEVYYIPRTIVNTDAIFNEDELSKFGSAYQVEMYLENTDGFEGDGDLLSKFGVEIRDSMTLVLATRRWEELVGRFQPTAEARPQEGDLIYFPLVKGLFQINYVEDDNPFYQLSNLPTFKLNCELFEYGNEAIDTGIADIDDFETKYATRTQLALGVGNGLFQVGEDVTQTNSASGITVTGEIATISTSDTELNVLNTYTDLVVEDFANNSATVIRGTSFPEQATHVKVSNLSGSVDLSAFEGTFKIDAMASSVAMYLSDYTPNHVPWPSAAGSVTAGTVEILAEGYVSGTTIEVTSQIASDGSNTLFAPTSVGTTNNIVVPENIHYSISGKTLPRASYKITSIDAFSSIDNNDPYAENLDFETIGNNFIDFSEKNPFGEPDITS
jgi:hypothetical protein